eukprot:gnl/Hemi2/13284_TR4554_c0_g1_i1.p1 gnl/Hemi2/13284_TR4554_c0_g1~~gnl/Hemi2/13284_TR4554_c0_g1_i1.p1  ORF type:complete len:950 (+),score=365.35 gnl/Hemi2/13284_TR4554_c0_g1_i1:155-3004(+)
MEAEHVNFLTLNFGNSISPVMQVQKQAEGTLDQAKTSTPMFSILLLKYIQLEEVNLDLRVTAAIYFKNMMKKHWNVTSEGVFSLPDEDRIQVKAVLVHLMCTPALHIRIRRVLAEALNIVSTHDFPAKWETLLPELIAKLNTSDLEMINTVLEAVHNIFRTYRSRTSDQALMEELTWVLNQFQEPLLTLFQMTKDTIDGLAANPQSRESTEQLFSILTTLIKIFYSLTCHDINDFFEQHLDALMAIFHSYLTLTDALLPALSDDTPSLLDVLRVKLIELLDMFISRYEEEMEKYLSTIVADIWNMLTCVGNQQRFDPVAVAGMNFLATLCKGVHSPLFAGADTQQNILEKVLVPNMKIRNADEEMFMDNPQEYIRRDIEGSDSDTRRHAAVHCVKELLNKFGPQVSAFATNFISILLQEYQSNPRANWVAKDLAIVLLTTVAARTATQSMGASGTNDIVDIGQFYQAHVLPELLQVDSAHPILVADALKFATAFRIQLSYESILNTVPALTGLLQSPNYVVHTYAAFGLDRLFFSAHKCQLKLTKMDLKPFLQPMAGALFTVLGFQDSKLNEYVMKALCSLPAVAEEQLAPYVGEILRNLTAILGPICENPSNPTFNHYLFDCVAALLRYSASTTPTGVAEAATILLDPLKQILNMDIAEFAPYVFQLLALLVEMHPLPLLADLTSMVPGLLTPGLWLKSTNVAQLTRLVQAFIQQIGRELNKDVVLLVLGVFQQMISSNMTDHFGFQILQSMLQYMDVSQYDDKMETILQLLFYRVQNSRTQKFMNGFLPFLSLVIVKNGPEYLFNKLGANVFRSLILEVWLPNVQKESACLTDRKLCAVAMADTLCKLPALLNEMFPVWSELLCGTVRLFEQPEEQGNGEEEQDWLEVEDSPGYVPAFLLYHGRKAAVDPLAGLPNPKAYFLQMLNALSAANPQVQQFLAQNGFNLK